MRSDIWYCGGEVVFTHASDMDVSPHIALPRRHGVPYGGRSWLRVRLGQAKTREVLLVCNSTIGFHS